MCRFPTAPMGFWKDVNNQRAFLAQVADSLGFRVSDTESWMNVEKLSNVQYSILEIGSLKMR